MDNFTPEMFDKDELDATINAYKQDIEALAINEDWYLRGVGKHVIDNSFDYMSIQGYFGTITARGGVGGTIGISGSGAVTEVNIAPSVSLSASVGYIWYIGNIEDL